MKKMNRIQHQLDWKSRFSVLRAGTQPDDDCVRTWSQPKAHKQALLLHRSILRCACAVYINHSDAQTRWALECFTFRKEWYAHRNALSIVMHFITLRFNFMAPTIEKDGWGELKRQKMIFSHLTTYWTPFLAIQASVTSGPNWHPTPRFDGERPRKSWGSDLKMEKPSPAMNWRHLVHTTARKTNHAATICSFTLRFLWRNECKHWNQNSNEKLLYSHG